jgi:hypothetical protein
VSATRAGCYAIESVHLALHAARKPAQKVPKALAPSVRMTRKRLLEVIRGLAAAERDEQEQLHREGAA